MLCVLFAIVAILFNLAPITYIVFGIAIVLSLLLQYRRFKKQAISERIHSRMAYALFVIITLSISWLVADWVNMILIQALISLRILSTVQLIGNEDGLIIANYQKVLNLLSSFQKVLIRYLWCEQMLLGLLRTLIVM